MPILAKDVAKRHPDDPDSERRLCATAVRRKKRARQHYAPFGGEEMEHTTNPSREGWLPEKS